MTWPFRLFKKPEEKKPEYLYPYRCEVCGLIFRYVLSALKAGKAGCPRGCGKLVVNEAWFNK